MFSRPPENKNSSPHDSLARAEELISEARESGRSFVDLSNLGLDELPESLWTLEELRLLELQGNRLSSIPSEVANLTHLEVLELSQNNITSLPPELFQLRSLQSLFLQSNALEKLPESDKCPISLVKFDISNNKLSELPSWLGSLSQLLFFYCNSNHLEFLPDSIGGLSNLQQLSASRNKIKVLPESIGHLKKLRSLDLSNNLLDTIPDEFSDLAQLSYLNLAGNAGLGLPSELLTISSQDGVRRKPSDLVRAFKKTRGGSGAQLRELKLLVVGRGGAGKTSLVRRLNGESFDRDEQETHGITIRNLKLECDDGPMIARVWDFGGQVILHAMHEFFLTARSLYLLVLTEREDLAFRDAQYWLQLIRVYAPDAPIVIALNKSAGRPDWDIDFNLLNRNFGPVIGWGLTDCETDLGIEDLKNLLVQAANQMPEPRKLFPKQWFSIKDAISSMPQAFMDFDEFRGVCAQHGETEVEGQNDLSSWLHDLGIALNYGRDPRLRDTTVLRPDWLANGIYAILRTNDLSRRSGKNLGINATLSEESISHIYEVADSFGMLELAEYPQDKRAFIMKLMGLFKLAFPIDPNSVKLLVPSLLGSNEPEGVEDSLKAPVRWRYAMKVVPAALLPKFIVRTFALSEGCLRWRRGCTLRFGEATATVRVNSDDNVVDVGIAGEGDDLNDLKKMIRGTFEEVFDEYKGIHVECQVSVEDNWVTEALLMKLSRSNFGA